MCADRSVDLPGIDPATAGADRTVEGEGHAEEPLAGATLEDVELVTDKAVQVSKGTTFRQFERLPAIRKAQPQ